MKTHREAMVLDGVKVLDLVENSPRFSRILKVDFKGIPLNSHSPAVIGETCPITLQWKTKNLSKMIHLPYLLEYNPGLD